MRLSRLFAAVAAVMVAFSSNISEANYVTSNGTVQLKDTGGTNNTGGNPPVVHIQEWAFGAGQLWTNQVAGAPFAPGNTIRTVGAISLTQVINGTVSPVVFPDGSEVHMLFAVEGTTVAPGVARFSAGSLWVTPSQTGNGVFFEVINPLAFNHANSIAKFDLAAPGDITDGATVGIVPAGNVSASASDVNLSAVSGIGPTGNGIFAFLEDLLFSPTGVDPGLAGFDGPDFLRDVEALPTKPNRAEGLAAFTDQTQDSTAVTLSAAQVAALDAIGAASGFSGAFSAGGFDPKGTSSAVQTGDFSADLSAEAYTIAAPVPEPASMLVWGLMGLFGLGYYRRRKNS